MVNITIVSRIKSLCSGKHISLSKLLLECNISKSFIYDLEKRDRTPSVEVLLKLSDYFNVSMDYMVGRTDNPEVNK